MKVLPTPLSGLFVIEPAVHGDARGYFSETFRADTLAAAGLGATFVQDNESLSRRGILRGLHFQEPNGQIKLVRVARGEVFDAVVDIRKGSPTFGTSYSTTLSAENHRQLWIPAGFAHGFCTLADDTVFLYKCSRYYSPSDERGIAWNDPALAIPWPIAEPTLSARDRAHPRLADYAGPWPAFTG